MRAYSVDNILTKRFNTLEFDGEWFDAVGSPEFTGTWFIYGSPKNGKTSFAMMTAKYLSNFKRVAYNSIEEGLSLSIRMAIDRVGMKDVSGRFVFLDKEPVSDMIERLKKHKSPDVVIVDSVQFCELKFSEYKRIKGLFPNKLFIYISHVEGKQPDGYVAKRILRDSNVSFRVEGFRAFPVSRYGGGNPIDVSKELADEYWGLKN